MTLNELFKIRLEQWGLRGDAFLWDDMEKYLGSTPPPACESDLERLIEEAFLHLVGTPLSGREDVFVDRYSHGGMSSGMICLEFWRTKAIPELLWRYRRMFPSSSDCLRLEDIQKDSIVFGIELDQMVRVINSDFLGAAALNVIYKTNEGAIRECLLYRTDEPRLRLAVPAVPLEFREIFFGHESLGGKLFSAIPQHSRPDHVSKVDWARRIAISVALASTPDLCVASKKDVCFVLPISVCEPASLYKSNDEEFLRLVPRESILYLTDDAVEGMTRDPIDSPLDGICSIIEALQEGKTILVLGSLNTFTFLQATFNRLYIPHEPLVKVIFKSKLSDFQIGFLYGIGSDSFRRWQRLKNSLRRFASAETTSNQSDMS